MIDIKVKKLSADAILPRKAGPLEAGIDLYAMADEWIPESLDRPVKVRTGVAFEIPDGYMGLVCDRSSLGSRGLKVFGGVIDAGFRGEVVVMLKALGDYSDYIRRGDKVAQMLVLPVPEVRIIEAEELSESERGTQGFGEFSGR